jgi:hypothetical protein
MNPEVQRTVDNVVLYDLMALAANEKALPQVRAIASLKLDQLKYWLTSTRPNIRDNEDEQAHLSWGEAEIAQFQKDLHISVPPPAEPPDGPPIGQDEDWELSPNNFTNWP